MEPERSGQAGSPRGKSRLDEWFLRVHSFVFLAFAALLILLGAWQYATASPAGAVPAFLDYPLRAVLLIAPVWAVAIGLFTFRVGPTLRALYPHPESSAWTHYVLLTRLLLPVAGLKFYRRMRAAYDESVGAKKEWPSANAADSGSPSTLAPKGWLSRGTRIGTVVGDVVFAVWPFVLCWLLFTLWGKRLVVTYSDMTRNVWALAEVVLCALVAVIGLWALVQVDRFERGPKKLAWWAVVGFLLPVGATLYWFCHLRRRVRSAGKG